REARLHKSEWTHQSYQGFVQAGVEQGGRRPQYQTFLDNKQALSQGQMSPRELRRAFEKARVGGGSRAAVLSSLEVMEGMTSEHEHIRDIVKEPGVPVLVLFESAQMGQHLITAMEAAVINA